jgi:hypothetical protein
MITSIKNKQTCVQIQVTSSILPIQIQTTAGTFINIIHFLCHKHFNLNYSHIKNENFHVLRNICLGHFLSDKKFVCQKELCQTRPTNNSHMTV